MTATSLMTRNACCVADAEHARVAVLDMYGLTSKQTYLCPDKDDTNKDADRDDADKGSTDKGDPV